MLQADLLQLHLLHDRGIDRVPNLTEEVIAMEVISLPLVISNDDRENVRLLCRWYLCLWDRDRLITQLLKWFALLLETCGLFLRRFLRCDGLLVWLVLLLNLIKDFIDLVKDHLLADPTFHRHIERRRTHVYLVVTSHLLHHHLSDSIHQL